MNLKALYAVEAAQFFVKTNNKNELLRLIKNRLTHPGNNPFVCTYIYLGSLYYAYVDSQYFKSLVNSDSVHLDGFFIGWIIKLLYKRKVSNFTTSEYLADLLEYCQQNGKRVYVLGSDKTEKGIVGAIGKIKSAYPKLHVSGYNGYFEIDELASDMMRFKPNVLIVGLGLHHQEKWIYQNIGILKKVNVVVAVGNYVDILGGKITDAPTIFKDLHLRWLYRLFKEPRRLWQRYLFGLFILLIIVLIFIKKKLIPHRNSTLV